MSEADISTRVARLEFGLEAITPVIRELKDQLEHINTNSIQIHAMTSALDQLSSKITEETMELRAAIKLHIDQTSASYRELDKRCSDLNLDVNTHRAAIKGQVDGARLVSSLVAGICALFISFGCWVVTRELGSLNEQLHEIGRLREKVQQLEMDMLRQKLGGQK